MNHPFERRSGKSLFTAIDADRLFAGLDENRERSAETIGLVVLFAAFDHSAMTLRKEVEKLGAVVMIIEDPFLPESWIASRDKQIGCLIFDTRYLASKGAKGVPARLRGAAPSPAIIMLGDTSCPVGSADSEPAEVILPTPVGGTELRLGILSAIDMRRGH